MQSDQAEGLDVDPATKPRQAKPAKAAAAEQGAETQAVPTAPRPTDAQGYELDEWGLPFVGPARLAALGDRTDPNVNPEGWLLIAAAAGQE